MPGLFSGERSEEISRRGGATYLLYAVGEVILIFVGVTLAVAFENSADARRDAELAAGLLAGVEQDLEANAEELRNNIRVDEDFLASVNRVLTHLESSSEWNDSVSVELENALHWSSPFLSTSGYEGLKQAGMYRVSDQEVRRSIVHLFESTYGFLVGDLDRSMWVYSESVLNPLVARELRRTDSGNTDTGLVAPRDYAATRESGALRSALLEQQSSLVLGLALRRDALDETLLLLESISG